MPAIPPDLFAYFAKLGIETETFEHPPVFTVAESRSIKAAIAGGHSKNLFLKDKKDRIFLVVARDETRIDLKKLHETIGASGRLSFGSPDLLRATLGVEPGSVTPFALINDAERRVAVVLDASLMAFARVNFHPLINSMTTTIGSEDFLAFLRATGHEARVLRLPEPASEASADSARAEPALDLK
ncbi:MAG TPA: prolyl-tRNA synthetase associated domain-containing protein [Beijerinckiaceae bacterium]|nr:prolyl-tRNA synthetase associated domain-containing protein [Beijerinckiaceae bacterium]